MYEIYHLRFCINFRKTRNSKRLLADDDDVDVHAQLIDTPTKACKKQAAKKQKIEIPKTKLEIIKCAKSAFRASSEVELVGRQKQRVEIENFIKEFPLKKKGSALFVSGCPGTGKTAFVSRAIDQLCKKKTTKVVHLNCMTCGNNPKSIFAKLYAEISGSTVSIAEGVTFVEEELKKQKGWTLLFLDEIDQLVVSGVDQSILYRIFEWPLTKAFKCSVIGVANAMDLIDRILPRLIAKNAAPQMLSFPSYPVQDLKEIIKSRLHLVDIPNLAHTLFQEAALDLCCRKVAAYGDFRKALDICRHALEELERELKLNPNIDIRVTVKHVIKVLDMTFGSGNPMVGKLSGATTHSKIIVSIMLQIQKEQQYPRTSCKVETSLERTYEIYVNTCRFFKDIPEMTRSEFNDVLTHLEALGILNIVENTLKSKTPKSKTPKSKVTTPKSNRTPLKQVTALTPKQPKHVKSSPATTPKFHRSLLDPRNFFVLNMNEKEVLASVKNVPFLEDINVTGLPERCFIPSYFDVDETL